VPAPDDAHAEAHARHMAFPRAIARGAAAARPGDPLAHFRARAFPLRRVMNDILSMSDAVDAESSSSLNPNATTFVPSWQPTATHQPPASSHGAHEHVETPQQHWHTAHGYGYAQPHGYNEAAFGDDEGHYFAHDGAVAHALDLEDAMRQSLYQPPQKPQGNTYGRARGHQQGYWAGHR